MWPDLFEDWWSDERPGEAPYRAGLYRRPEEQPEPHYEQEDENDGND